MEKKLGTKSGKKFRIKSKKKNREKINILYRKFKILADEFLLHKVSNQNWILALRRVKNHFFFSNYSVVYNFLCMIVHEIWGGWDRPLKVEVPIRLWQLDANVDDL